MPPDQALFFSAEIERYASIGSGKIIVAESAICEQGNRQPQPINLPLKSRRNRINFLEVLISNT